MGDLQDGLRLHELMSQYRSWFTVGVVGTGVAHELAGVLMSIMGNAALLREQVSGNGVSILDDLDAAVNRASLLLGNLQESYQKRNMQLKDLSLGTLVRQIASHLEVNAAAPIALQLDLNQEIKIQADTTLMSMMLLDLMSEPCRQLAQSVAGPKPTLAISTQRIVDEDAARVGIESERLELKFDARDFQPWNFPKGAKSPADIRLRTHYYFSLARSMMRLFRGEVKVADTPGNRETLSLVFPIRK